MSKTVSGEELEKINGYAREPLTEDKVFVFRVALCDNDIDRDGEKFSSGALRKLAELFKGRTGIFDHDPKSSKQTARIFDTWVETLPEKTTTDGEVYRRLMAKAYMVRTASNSDLIGEIQSGIKKEASISCTMGEKLCSVCGEDMHKGGCDHKKGGEYGGKLCYHILDEPLEAYEWSFVAVPAQVKKNGTKSLVIRREAMREILFRGKRVDNGEWVYGYYVLRKRPYFKDKGVNVEHLIYDNMEIEDNDYKQFVDTMPISYVVDPKTISQYTGLTDKYDKKIFEGDIINVTPDITNRLMDVRWNDETLSWELTDVGTPAFGINHIFNTIDLAELEVESCYGERISFIVGNIYDNPELLKQTKKSNFF